MGSGGSKAKDTQKPNDTQKHTKKKKKKKKSSTQKPNLRDAIKSDDVKQVKQLLDEYVDANRVYEFKQYSSKHGSKFYTPLMWAIIYDSKKVFKFLITHKTLNLEATSTGGRDETALIMAARHGHADFVQSLLLLGVHTDKTNRDGFTALMLARKLRHPEVFRILLSDRCTWDDHIRGKTALMIAAQSGDADDVRLFLTPTKHDERPVHVNLQDKGGNTALSFAVAFRHTEVLKVLVNAPTSPSIKLSLPDENGLTPLMKVIDVKDARVLIEALPRKDLDAVDNYDRTALMWSVIHNSPAVIRALIDAHVDVLKENAFGTTALMMAKNLPRPDSNVIEDLAKAEDEARKRAGDAVPTVEPPKPGPAPPTPSKATPDPSKDPDPEPPLTPGEDDPELSEIDSDDSDRSVASVRFPDRMPQPTECNDQPGGECTPVAKGGVGTPGILHQPAQHPPVVQRPQVIRRLLDDGVTPVTVGIGSAALLLFGFIGYQLWKRATKPRHPEMVPEDDLV